MYHLRKIKVLLATCLLACTSLWAQDVKISLENAKAKATSEQGGDEAASSAIDGDYGKFWHSQWSWGAVFNSHSKVELTIALSEVTLVDYVRYIPRQNHNNGHWGEVEVFYSSSTTGTNFTSVGTFNLNKADIPYDFFLNGMDGVSCGQIKFTIRSGSNNHATAAEIEMYQLNKGKLNAFAQYFTDDLYTQLKSGVSSNGIADTDVKALVASMLSNAPSYKKFRVGEYKAYETLGTLKNRLKTKNPYSKYENPTGVYFQSGQMYLVAVSGVEDDAVGLKVKNWYTNENSSSYPLHNGLNYITATSEGNVFVNYYTDDYAKAPNVKIHFINAPVLGYWDAETMDNDDWVEMLADKAADDNRIIITQSEHAQLAFPISAWKRHCPTDVETLMERYQSAQWALRDMMGLEKYGYQTKNRQLFYVVDGGFMAAGEEGAYCDYSDLGGIMNANSFDFWGVAHEWGHNNQIAPGFHWSGCGETTNNIYASWAQFHFTGHRDANGHPTNLRLEDEVTGINDYKDMRGGRMQTYFEEGLRKGVAWQLQDGPDYHNATPETITVTGRDADGKDLGQVTTTSRNYDHFVKLTPFWQLNLWGNLAEKSPDIITDVIHSIRTAENYTATYNTNGKQQINWMKLACDAAKINLLPFFEKAGMLRPIHAYIEDYGAGWNIINEAMINELKDYVKTKGYPAFTEEINYINAHNMHIYRDNLKLNVTKMQGVRNGDKVTIQHSVDGEALNAVAFETYNAQGDLIRITMYGLGSDDAHSYTQVLFPSSENAAYIMAVGYDGIRQIVYSELSDESSLQTLIVETKVLVNVIADVNYGSDIDMKSCNITSNYAASGYGTENLVDGNPATFFHSTYGGNTSAKHNLVIDLKDQRVSEFMINYTTLPKTFNTGTSNNTDAPTNILVEGSNDGSSYSTIATLSSGLPTGVGAEYISDVLGDASTSYRYIRLTVNSSNGGVAGIYKYYFGLAELSLTRPITVSAIGDKYAEYISAEQIKFVCEQILIAQQKCTAGTATSEDVEALQSQYNLLLDVYNRADNEVFNALKEELRTLIASTNSLINSCGEEAPIVGVLPLQAADNSGRFCVSSNADQNTGGGGNDGGGIAALVDNSENTYFHTRWGGTEVNEPHYIQVDMGKGVTIQQFVFSYKPRSGSPAPTAMKVYGSNDVTSFTDELATITSGLPAHGSGSTYTSDLISSDTPYRYLRFVVTGSQGPGNNQYGGQYFFGMLEFDLDAKDSYAIEVSPNAGDVTLDLLLATYNAMQKAQNVINNVAITENQLQTAINSLQAQYDALLEAKNAVQYTTFTITSNVSGGGVEYGEQSYTENLDAPYTLTADDLEAINLDLAGYVAKNISVEGTVIIVTYNKLYTVQVTGGKGNGGVVYNDVEYKDFFDAPIDEEIAPSAIPVEGYYEGVVTVDNENAIVYVRYSAIPLVDTEKYYTLACKATDHSAYIRDNGSEIHGRSAEGSLFQFEAADDDNGYYIKSYVTDKYLNYNGSNIYVDVVGTTIWTMASHSTGAMTLCIGNDQYLNNNGSENAVCPYLQIKAHNGGPSEGNACSLWTITEGTPLDKSELKELIDATNELIESCYTEGVLNYTCSAYINEEFMTRIQRIVDDAQAKYESKATVAGEYNAVLEDLRQAKAELDDNLSLANQETSDRTQKRNELNELINLSNQLLADCAENPGDATDALIEEVNVVVTSAQAVANNMGSTVDELVAATEALQAKYDVLAAVQQSTAKATLRALIAQAEVLITECGTYGFGEHMVKTPVALQVDHVDEAYYLFTNADHNVVGGGAKDGDGIAALIDGNVNTYMHTQWGGTPVTDNHYVQVDLGNDMGLAEFAFTYATRKGSSANYTSPAPTIIEVYGSSDGITFNVQIARFTSSDETNPLISYKELGEYWESANIKPSRNYGYLRFYVRESEGPQSNTQHGDHYYFAMSEFALSAVSYETSYYVESLTSYGNVTEEQFLNVARAYDEANDLVEKSYDKAALETATVNLQAVYNVLQAAHNDYSYLPVTLTTDVENPVLYVMGSQRGEGKVLQYDSAPDHMFSIVEPAEVNVNHLFYFTKGTKKGQVYVHPFTADGQVLAASDKEEGDAKVSVAEKEDASAMQWTFEQETIDETVWYSLKGVDAPYFSHHGGGTNKMGFYGLKDEGSRFTLTTMKCHAVKIGQYKHTSLYLDYPTIIPEGVKAYIAKNPSEKGTIDLMKLQGNVLPANTGVILYSETLGTYYFLAANASATDDVSENLLKGSASEQYVGDETSAKKYYIFGRKDDNVGLYRARMDYTADGTYVGNDKGTHFKASANKVYLELDATSAVALSGFRFRVGGDETGIEGITIDADATIYDLYGRRVLEVVTPGLYIINGEKRYINIK